MVVANPEDQHTILLEPFLHMGQRMVLAMPWTPDFDANAMRSMKAPVWIDLPLLNPAFAYYANQMLAKVGTAILYAQTANSRSKFSHIRGCVLCNLNKDLVEYIDMSIPNIGRYRVDTIYRTLLDACFAYKQRGHIARYCPTKTNTTTSKIGMKDTNNTQEPGVKLRLKQTESDQDCFTMVKARE